MLHTIHFPITVFEKPYCVVDYVNEGCNPTFTKVGPLRIQMIPQYIKIHVRWNILFPLCCEYLVAIVNVFYIKTTTVELVYVRFRHMAPINPGSHPFRQVPSIWEQLVPSKQKPHVLLHSIPYAPGLQAKIIIRNCLECIKDEGNCILSQNHRLLIPSKKYIHSSVVQLCLTYIIDIYRT